MGEAVGADRSSAFTSSAPSFSPEIARSPTSASVQAGVLVASFDFEFRLAVPNIVDSAIPQESQRSRSPPRT